MKHLMHAMSLSLVLTSPITLGLSAIAQQGYEEQAAVQADDTQVFWGAYRPYDPIFEAEPAATPLFALRVEEDESGPVRVAQASDQEAWNAFANSQYDYWDALVLSKFWNESPGETKVRMGRKLIWGGDSKVYLEQKMLDARVHALSQAEQLTFFFASGYNYDDAVVLAKFWGDASPYEGKLRAERNIIIGDRYLVESALAEGRRR